MAEALASDGRKFGQYEVESVLGRGAMGMVYLARDRRIGRRVALKTVQVDQKFDDESDADEFFKRLQREAEVVGAMQHPNIVTLYEPGYENNVISYLATEYVDGESLKDRLKRSKPLPLDDALRLGEDILRGLAYAHAKGIIHRDIKPANILLTSDGQAKLADFGIARPIDSNLTAVGSMLGTPNYMSPEQVKCAAVTNKSDLFAVGTVLYEMLTGSKPYAAPDVSGILRNVMEKEPRLASAVNVNVPEPVARLVARLSEKSPDERFESAAAALIELQRLRGEVPAERVEEITPDLAISTLATTPPIGSASTTQRTTAVAAPLFWTVITAAILPLLAWGGFIRAQTDPRPIGVITPTQIADFNLKKSMLSNARALADAGRYDESLQTYDTFLQRFPGVVAAVDGRADTEKRLEAARAKATVTTRAVKTPQAKKEEPPKKPSLWQRLFHRGKK